MTQPDAQNFCQYAFGANLIIIDTDSKLELIDWINKKWYIMVD